MKRSKVLLAVVLAAAVMAASVILGACSGGGSGGTPPAAPPAKVQLSGTITGYTVGKATYGKTFSAPASPIDTVVAIPMTRGTLDARNMESSVTGTIGGDGTFNLALPTDKDWLLVMIDSPNTFVGSIAISAGSESILSLPATVSTLTSINLGTITGAGGDAVSSPTVTASDFGMNANQFTAFANSDDVFKNAKNIINNYNATGQAGSPLWYQLRPDFTWDGDYDVINGAFSGPTWTYQSYNFQMDTNATNLTIQNLCTNGTLTFVSVGWTPPVGATITMVGSSTTFSTGNPIMNSAATCTAYMSDGVPAIEASSSDYTRPFYATDAYGTLSYGMPAWFDGTIPPGDWTWSEGGVVKATFDPSVSTPVNGDGVRSLGYVPSIKLTTAGGVGTAITAVDVEWWYFDEALDSYTKVTSAADLAVMSHFIERAEIIIESAVGATTRRHSSFGFDPTVPAELPLALPASGVNMWTYADTTCGSFLESDAGTVGVFYSSGGIGRYFFARAPICP
jgi:hypothetical protein